MEEIEKRLRDATDACLAARAEWETNKKHGPAREKLQEAVHELRKVAARLEIELAVSERDEIAARPLPIPPHRSNRKRPGEPGDFNNDEDGGNAHSPDSSAASEQGIARTMGRRRRPGGGQSGPFGSGAPQGERSSGGDRNQTPGSGPQPSPAPSTTGTLSPTGGARTE